MITLKVKVVYKEELLGTLPADKELHSKYIASKAPNAETREQEIAEIGAEEYEDKTMTVFRRDEDGNPVNIDYQWKGYFKDACGMLRDLPNYKSKKLRAYKKRIDGQIHVFPRYIPLVMPKGGKIGSCQRPLRAQTAQGERVALANSETVPAGTTQEFEVLCMNDDHLDLVIEWLTYGELHGTGQWRNAGMGRFYFTASYLNEKGDVKTCTNMPMK